MKKLINHIRRWNIWRKGSLNNRWYKLLVLLGFIDSLTMCVTLLPEEEPLFDFHMTDELAVAINKARENAWVNDYKKEKKI